MAGFISQATIDEVTARTDIVRVVSDYVPLVQKGNDWWGCCPFHHEKTASFSVSSEKKFYYCFGCHAGGTAINFIMEMEKLSYPEAVTFLARKQGIQIQYSEGGLEQQKEDPAAKLKQEYTDLYTRVAGTFHYMLTSTDAGAFALDYITKRGISMETIQKFKLGYSPRDRFWLKKFLLEKNYSKEFLEASGLFSKKYPDIAFFTDRLMFPIFDRSGNVVAMGGRFLRGDAEHSPKYLNSGDLPQYKKGSTLYAFNFARQAIRETKRVIFCEGYMDCIAYHQCGINYAVAPLGTALTEDQIRMVKPFVQEILLSFDSDKAGQEATRRAILMCRKQDITVRIIQLTGAKDPAEIMLNFGKDTLTKDVELAILDSDFLLSKLQELYPKNSPEGKKAATLSFFEYMDALQSDVQKNACLEQLCQTFDINLEAARKDFTNRAHRGVQERSVPQRLQSEESVSQEQNKHQVFKPNAELRAVLTAVTADPIYFQKMRSRISVDDLTDPQARKLFIIMEECSRSGSFSVSNILNRCESEQLKSMILKSDDEYSSNIAQSVDSSILYVERTALERKRLELVNRMRRLERSALPEDKALLSELLSQKMDLDNKIVSLKRM